MRGKGSKRKVAGSQIKCIWGQCNKKGKGWKVAIPTTPYNSFELPEKEITVWNPVGVMENRDL